MLNPTDRITHTTAFATPVVEHWLELEISVKQDIPSIPSLKTISRYKYHRDKPVANRLWNDAYKRTLAANRKE